MVEKKTLLSLVEGYSGDETQSGSILRELEFSVDFRGRAWVLGPSTGEPGGETVQGS